MQVEVVDCVDYSKIYYFNDGISYRTLVLDKDKNIIQDEISEYDTNGKHIADVVFAQDYTTIIAMRKYTADGFEDYRLLDGSLVLVQYQKNEWLEPEKKLKVGFYNAHHQLVYYDLFEKDDNEQIGMVIMGSFDSHDVAFTWDNKPKEVSLLQSYSDY